MIFPDTVYMLVFLHGAFQYIFTKLLRQISRLIGGFHSRHTFIAWWSTENRVTALTKVFFIGMTLCLVARIYNFTKFARFHNIQSGNMCEVDHEALSM